MTAIFSRYLRLAVCVLVAALTVASPDFDAEGAAKRRKRKTRTSRVTKRRTKRKTKAAPALPVVVLGSTDPIEAPEPFVTLPSVKEAPDGLEGRTIAVWPFVFERQILFRWMDMAASQALRHRRGYVLAQLRRPLYRPDA